MTQVIVPVRHPLTEHSRATLTEGVRVAEDRDADLTILHVNLYQQGNHITRRQLKESVEGAFGHLPRTRYVVRSGILVEETILEEIAAQKADVVVIGKKQAGRWRSMIRRIVDDADVERFLREEVNCEVLTATPN